MDELANRTKDGVDAFTLRRAALADEEDSQLSALTTEGDQRKAIVAAYEVFHPLLSSPLTMRTRGSFAAALQQQQQWC